MSGQGAGPHLKKPLEITKVRYVETCEDRITLYLLVEGKELQVVVRLEREGGRIRAKV